MKSKKAGKVKLPFHIRSELRMLCAMKGYSSMKGGKGKTLMQQHDALFAYYHGKAPSRPSQIKLLCSGGYGFEDLYDSKQKMATSKSDNTVTTEELILKKELHRDPVRTFRATKEINAIDLEKKLQSGALLVTGRTLLALAKKGNKFYKRALSFALQKWDIDKGAPKESGATLDDVLLFVRQGMYNFLNKTKDDSDDDDELDDANTDDTARKIPLDANDASPTKVTLDKETDDGSGSSDDSVVEVPEDFIFPGYMAFRQWGPFAAPEDRLLLFESKDAPKNAAALSRAAKRKLDMEVKDVERATDDSSKRGFSTDQRISIEGFYLQRKMQKQQELDSSMVALIAHDASIGRQIEAAERRAIQRCPDFTATNVHWKVVEDLVSKQAEITKRMDGMSNIGVTEGEKDRNSFVTQFLDGTSPGDNTITLNSDDDSSSTDGDVSPVRK